MKSELRGVQIFTSQAWQMNSLVIPGALGFTLVDPGFFPDELAAIADYVRQDARAPALLVYTHGDFDHIVGEPCFPAVPSVAQAAFAGRDSAGILKQLAAFDAELYIERAPLVRYPAPTVVFAESHRVETGSEPILLYHTPGHSEDSLVAVLPDRELLVAGDMLSDLEFPFVDYDSAAYLDSLARVADLVEQGLVTAAIPGHGRPAATKHQLADRIQRDVTYLEAMRAAAEQARRQGQSQQEAGRLLWRVQYGCRPVEAHLRGYHRKNARQIVREIYDANH